MTQYEYKIEIIPYKAGEALAAELNTYGQQGWHCFQINYAPENVIIHLARKIDK